MDEVKLTAKELLYAAAKMGAHTFFGIPDPFFGMDDDEMRRQAMEIQLSLVANGHASMGFDDEFTLDGDVSALVGVCAHCDRYISADLSAEEGTAKNRLFYVKDAKAAELVWGVDYITLSYVAADEIAEMICRDIVWSSAQSADAQPHTLPFSTLTDARQSAQSNPKAAAEALAAAGCPPALADVLLDGLREKAGYYAVCMSDLRARSMEHLVFISSEAGAVRVSPVFDGGEDRWEVAPIDRPTVEKRLRGMCAAAPSEEAGAL